MCRAVEKAINSAARDMELRARYPHAIIDDGCCMTDDVLLGEHAHVLGGCFINHSQVGNYSYIGRNSLVQHTSIGNYCSISQDCLIGLGTHPLDRFSTSPLFYHRKNTFGIELVHADDFQDYQPIAIGNDVWVGARATILDGIKIGNGAVIATGAVVTKDVPPYAIVAGVPARVVRFRTSEDNAEKLSESQWWSLDPQEAYAKMTKI